MIAEWVTGMQQHMGQVITIAVYKHTNVETLLHTSGSPCILMLCGSQQPTVFSCLCALVMCLSLLGRVYVAFFQERMAAQHSCTFNFACISAKAMVHVVFYPPE
jgi:hypothetical protein